MSEQECKESPDGKHFIMRSTRFMGGTPVEESHSCLWCWEKIGEVKVLNCINYPARMTMVTK